jgi:hypothetical protein
VNTLSLHDALPIWIRLEIHEETKDLTPEQRVERTRRITNPIIERYGLTVIDNAQNDPRSKTLQA